MPPSVNPTINAIEKYQAALRENPTSAEAHTNLGWGYYGKHQLPEALKAFNEALALDGNYAEAHYGLGLVHKALGSKADALAAFEKAVAAAERLDDPVRRQMLTRLIKGHLSLISTGDWQLGAILSHK